MARTIVCKIDESKLSSPEQQGECHCRNTSFLLIGWYHRVCLGRPEKSCKTIWEIFCKMLATIVAAKYFQPSSEHFSTLETSKCAEPPCTGVSVLHWRRVAPPAPDQLLVSISAVLCCWIRQIKGRQSLWWWHYLCGRGFGERFDESVTVCTFWLKWKMWVYVMISVRPGGWSIVCMWQNL